MILSWPMLNLPFLSPAVSSSNVSFRKGSDVEVLTSIHEPSVNVAVWKRVVRDDLAAESAAWASHEHEIETVVNAQDPLSGPLLSHLPAGSALLADIGFLLKLFVGLSRASRIHVFFGAVRDDQCRKFHQDYVRLRLIQTYFGPGTEWAPEDAVCREAIDKPCESVADANRLIVPNASLVQHIQPGEIIVLKGTRYPGNARGAIHRSPPIAHLGLTRVVFVLTTHDK